ncbi:uncharacterized protein A1O9_09220 [Exophiala aquamarina CBS 119918]|uniref:DNA repair metallo-beta-lactamase domain-containing protein n=1 Tax=Exophiala aquamarina CBS 119918 TaxID=1182545 RepID=A0A072P6A3_9EURO|nr:uncharacterized protein A1O9_09220 [Exophiala aquamarina CBS 119918]KEF54778.1 hypothetical protein A1O9_09220 [Exophiala aquamarina CBS 119918]
MFRNPRENTSLNSTRSLLPSTGRPPTPPSTNEPKVTSSPFFAAPKPTSEKKTPMSKTPVLGRQVGSKIPSSKKPGFRQNQSILSFFAKSDKPEVNDIDTKSQAPLFFKDAQESIEEQQIIERAIQASKEQEQSRFNEDETPIKRRRTESQDVDWEVRTPSPEPHLELERSAKEESGSMPLNSRERTPKKWIGGFVDDSSDDEDVEIMNANGSNGQLVLETVGGPHLAASDDIDVDVGISIANPLKPSIQNDNRKSPPTDIEGPEETTDIIVPALNREGTSMFVAEDFGDEEDFDDDEFFEGGEEYMERRWMEEQREMDMGLDEDSKSESGAESVTTPRSIIEHDGRIQSTTGGNIPLCPICNGNMKGLSEDQASSHVNACLDGAAQPFPQTTSLGREGSLPLPKEPEGPVPKRFQRAAIARPAQSNPFTLNQGSKGGSAFTRLMSGHAEDAAWAAAATNEAHSRGKPAYQRTCPFYKIMPGFFICVDAFRYGKVEGQNAYFLSHFHSDHYIGLTSSWCHGPIYASKVTCNLMIQQLKVDPKWVVPLEFEKNTEVPNTKGVFVTMLPANHCPGSSLYLFEKVTGKNRDGSPKATRILHCGDFRACPAHISHPLLRPDVVDSITGQMRQQVIDTCYLDTTYLTPKYSFPGQYDVIDACAQMCVSLSGEMVDSTDSWEQTKTEKAGSAMKKFLEQGESESVKEQEPVEKKQKARGRLLVVIGTYSIGKERICLGIAKALNSKIYAPPGKMRICACLEDPELNARLTNNPLEAQVHMQTLMEIRAETLHDYMMTYKGHFARVVGFRPTGWSYRPPTSRFTENPAVSTVLNSDGWKSRFTMRDLAPQRGSTKESNCFGVPYSEHSSFRELTMFCCALRINRIIPTVNVGSAKNREKMKGWIEKWDAEKRKNGLFKVEDGGDGWGSGDGKLSYGV